jgi:hypothetical protein
MQRPKTLHPDDADAARQQFAQNAEGFAGGISSSKAAITFYPVITPCAARAQIMFKARGREGKSLY